MRLRAALFAFVVLIATASAPYALTDKSLNANVVNQESKLTTAFYAPHAPIVITSDADFLGWPGNGTESNPYVIEGLNITSTEICINISRTTTFFEIRACLISSEALSAKTGISLANLTNGMVRDCVVEEHDYGVALSHTKDCTLFNNAQIGSSGRITCGFSLYDSNGTTLIGNNATRDIGGFGVYSSEGCTLTNNRAVDFTSAGFEIVFSDQCTLSNNVSTVSQDNISPYGFVIVSSDSCILTDNTASNCGYDFPPYPGLGLGSFLEVSGNKVNGKPLGYFANLVGNMIDVSEYGEVLVVNCSNVIVKNGIFSRSSIGIALYNCTGCSLMDNTADNSRIGFHLGRSNRTLLIDNYAAKNYIGFKVFESDYCTLTNNAVITTEVGTGFWIYESMNCTVKDSTVTGNGDGFSTGFLVRASLGCTLTNNSAIGNLDCFSLDWSDNCNLINNTATHGIFGFSLSASDECALVRNIATNNTGDGFCLLDADRCVITGNTASRNNIGFYLGHSNACTIANNTAVKNRYGIYVEQGSANNTIFLNRFGYNRVFNAFNDGSSNFWDNGVSLGNYWSDYAGNGTYFIPGSAGSMDHFPLLWNQSTTAGESPTQLPLPILAVGLGTVVILAIAVLFFRSRRITVIDDV